MLPSGMAYFLLWKRWKKPSVEMIQHWRIRDLLTPLMQNKLHVTAKCFNTLNMSGAWNDDQSLKLASQSFL